MIIMEQIESHEIKQILLNLMDDIHQFCDDNQIKYSLAFGTLIGAMRHKGFIPWDDDIDIYMMREDYDRFRATYKPRKDYIKLNDPEKDNNYNRSFLKVEDTRTIVYEISALSHLGISVDIFPVDNLFNDINKSKKLCQRIGLIRKLHMIKALTYKNNIGFVKKLIMLAGKIALLPWGIHSITLEMISLSKKGQNNSEFVGILDMNHNEDLIFKRDIYDSVHLLEFEGRNYFAMRYADKWLRSRYGDYMELPPIENRENGSCHEFSGTYFR